MNSVAERISPHLDWQGPGAPDPARRIFEWKTLLWSLVFPPRRHRISTTIPGLFLMALSVSIGTAAYNTASNILFITLSLMLACLLLSGLLSWFNFAGVSWRMRPPSAWRVGHETIVAVELRNGKAWLPTYGLWLDFTLQPRHRPVVDDEELSVREVLRSFEKSVVRGRTHLRERLEPQGDALAEWVLKPAERGEATLELVSVGSLFPFGFLRKNIGAGLKRTVLVWPAQVEYRWIGAPAAPGGRTGRRTARAGSGDDLLALRKYALGDSHRLIHWKASARLGRLMVRQFAAESPDGYTLWIDTPADRWTNPAQFELLCSFAATLAEDLFAAGRLQSVRLPGGGMVDVRQVRDLEAFLDGLARLQPGGAAAAPAARSGNLVTFAPEGARGVTAYADGQSIASA